MIRIAFFVEGQTEKIFIEKFLEQYLSYQDIKIKSFKPKNRSSYFHIIKATGEEDYDEIKYYFLIFDAGGGGKDRMATKVSEEAKHLLENGDYKKIFGICDLHERNEVREDKNKALKHMYDRIQKEWTSINLIQIILAVMDIEAWFLADHSLFSKVDPRLTPEYIKQKLGKDLIKEDPEKDYNKPAELIKDIYRLVDKIYDKHEGDSYKIVHRIDYDYLCLETKGRKIKAFHLLVEKLREVLN